MKIGVLRIQGDIEEHFSMTEKAMKRLGIKGQVLKVDNKKDIEKISGLIIPGGESTVIGSFLKRENLLEKVKIFAKKKAIMGTCAGAILLAKKCDDKNINLLNLMSIKVNRNAYGRQRESFEAPLKIKSIGEFRGIFIRAPVIEKTWGKARVLAWYEKKAVMVQQGKLLALTFHPELSEDTRLHEYFLSLARNGNFR